MAKAAKVKRFSGKNAGEEFQIDSSNENYMIVIGLESNIVKHKKKIDKSYPPMPFVIDGLALYQNDGYYSLTGNGLDANGMKPEESNRIVIVNSDAGARYYGNGFCFSKADKMPSIKNIRIGAGYHDRFWAGKVSEFYVVKLPNKYKFDAENAHYAETEQMESDGVEVFRLDVG